MALLHIFLLSCIILGKAHVHPEDFDDTPKSWTESDSAVVHLTDDNFESIVAKRDRVLVAFYTPASEESQVLQDEFEFAADKLAAKQPVLAAVDLDTEKRLAEKFKLSKGLNLKYFENGLFAFDVEKRNTKEQLLDFMENPMEESRPIQTWHSSNVIHLTPDDFDKTLKRKEHALVMFYVDWCPHCKRAKPKLMEAAYQMKFAPDEFAFCAVDCISFEDFCHKKNNATKVPTFIYFHLGKDPVKYEGVHETIEIVDYMLAKPVEVLYDFWKWDTMNVIQLYPDTFDGGLLRHFRSLIFFFDMTDAKSKRAKKHFTQAADAADHSLYLFGAVDCSENREFCNDLGVEIFPTFKVYHGTDFRRNYNGPHTKDMFLNALAVDRIEL